MDNVHGVDISWMTTHSSKADHSSKPQSPPIVTKPDKELKLAQIEEGDGTSSTNGNSNGNGNGHKSPVEAPTKPKPIPTPRPNLARSASSEKTVTLNGGGKHPPSPGSRRNSWLSSISSKFSSSPGASSTTPPATPPGSLPTASPATDSTIPPGPQSPKNAVLPHGVKAVGDAPYTPAPPKSTQPSFLQSALRRLSSSGGQLSHQPRPAHNGLCERKVLNVDRHRERCSITDLNQSKLRRVAFCVDVEIASGPKYHDEIEDDKKAESKRRVEKGEKGEAEALKNPETARVEKEEDGVIKATGEKVGKDAEKGALEFTKDVADDLAHDEKDTKKKEKKKRSEEERKARKEKKRKLAEANGSIPVELVRNASEDSLGSSLAGTGTGSGTPITQVSPTTDPVRIYRRCCQLRETPILKKITEQLTAAATNMSVPGIVNSLDLTGYWLQLPDLVTLGDYLAVVPVKELIMENCGLTDEGVRVILAGLLAAKCPHYGRRRATKCKDGEVIQGGVVERVVFKNNVKIGKDGWRYVCLFLNMCRSLKSFDLSMVPFPQSSLATTPSSGAHLHRTPSTTSNPEVSCLLSKAIGERLAGKEFELLNVAQCGLTTDQLGSLVDGAIKSGLRRLGVAGNNITAEGMQHIARYLKDGTCEGLDLGGNDLKDELGAIADVLDSGNGLYALSLADCNLTPDSLWTLFPALTKLKNFRFIDLSQNHALFEKEPSAISLLRRYIPKMPILRRIHLTDVSMNPDQAIALAEILPESSSLAHLTIMENPKIAALANAKEESSQEEACALYASLMAAVRVSNTLMCIDIEVPSNDSSEVVKALAKQVVAYCLRNMEHGPVAEISQATASAPSDINREVIVPDVLLHLVGHDEGPSVDHDDDDPAPDDDYVIGGSGVVKALGICLQNRGNDSRGSASDHNRSHSRSGTASPRPSDHGGKAKDMSKNLLGSARKIRARLQPALVKESRAKDRVNYQRLLFLDQTLEGMINRFEDEYPETRVGPPIPIPTTPETKDTAQESPLGSLSGSVEFPSNHDGQGSDTEPAHLEVPMSDDEGETLRPALSRHNSDVSIASRALNAEEGRMHRFGQQFRRDILKPDAEHTPGKESEPHHLQILRAFVEGLGGEEIRDRFHAHGHEALLNDMSNEAKALKQELKAQDPEGWDKFVESQQAAQRNANLQVGHNHEGHAVSSSAVVD